MYLNECDPDWWPTVETQTKQQQRYWAKQQAKETLRQITSLQALLRRLPRDPKVSEGDATIALIEAAAERLRGHARRTPLLASPFLDAIAGQTFQGRVDRISPVVDAGSGTFRVVAAFEGGGLLRPGMFGRIEVVYDERKDALTMPRVALLEDEGEPAVFVVREKKAVRVPVQLGYVNGEFAEVRAGLSEGDDVVTAGKVAIRDGSEVEVINAGPAPAVEAAIAQASQE